MNAFVKGITSNIIYYFYINSQQLTVQRIYLLSRELLNYQIRTQTTTAKPVNHIYKCLQFRSKICLTILHLAVHYTYKY